jgi:RES domain-containing protein
MRLWRVSRHEALDGEGGMRAAGRWHSRGRRIVYAAEHPALAILEVLVHLEIEPAAPPRGYALFEIEIPARLRVERAKIASGMLDDESRTRALGDAWLARGATPLLRVPSAAAPHAFNYLINPAHAGAAACRVAGLTPEPFDLRLWRG